MLIKDTIQYLSRRLDRSLHAQAGPLASLPSFQVLIPSDKLDLLVGFVLKNRYCVLSILGKGGMSLVYKAKDLKENKVVAIKALRLSGMRDEILVKRFRQEAEVLHRLNHPRIVGVYDYGTSERGQPFFVMDYLIGTSLNMVLKHGGPLPIERFQDIFVQVSAAVAHAHKHGAIHRDLKPGNIMLVEMGETVDYVKIVDFGIAKLQEDAAKLTRMGEVWGSPIYMSPEQGMGTDIDARTDIYSLGVVMYEALTGEVPFLGKNYVETMTMQISDPPPPFSEIAPDLNIPASLEMIVFRAMQKAPDNRYQTMTEMKQDIEKALRRPSSQDSETTKERPGSVFGFLKKQVAPGPETSSPETSKSVPGSAMVDTAEEPAIDFSAPGDETGERSGRQQVDTTPEPELLPPLQARVDDIDEDDTKILIHGVEDPEVLSASVPETSKTDPARSRAPEPTKLEPQRPRPKHATGSRSTKSKRRQTVPPDQGRARRKSERLRAKQSAPSGADTAGLKITVLVALLLVITVAIGYGAMSNEQVRTTLTNLLYNTSFEVSE